MVHAQKSYHRDAEELSRCIGTLFEVFSSEFENAQILNSATSKKGK